MIITRSGVLRPMTHSCFYQRGKYIYQRATNR